jgi:anti-anti-sigma factor
LDSATALAFELLLIQELDEGRRALVIDLSGCEFLGSMALATLVHAKHHAERTATALTLAGMNRIIARTLYATGLEPLFNVYPSAAEAVEALSRDQTGTEGAVPQSSRTPAYPHAPIRPLRR